VFAEPFNTQKGKLVCQLRQVCRNCSYLVTADTKPECSKKFCNFLKIKSNFQATFATWLHINLASFCTCSSIRSAHKTMKIVMGLLSMFRNSYVRSMCSRCETVDDLSVDCEQCDKRIHSFWQDPVGKFIDCLWQFRPFADNLYFISHISRGYDTQILLKSFLEIRWSPK